LIPAVGEPDRADNLTRQGAERLAGTIRRRSAELGRPIAVHVESIIVDGESLWIVRSGAAAPRK
jgi:hypothetical protein